MKLIFIKLMVVAIFLLLIPAYLLGNGYDKQIAGSYKSRVKDKSFIVLQLNDDKSAIIESTFWFGENTKGRRTNKYDANWVFNGRVVFVTYNSIEQILSYHDNLSLEAYGIEKSVPGLSTSDRNTYAGLLDSIKLWRQDELKKLLSDGKTVIRHASEGNQNYSINLTIILLLVSIISAIVGCQKPLIGGIIGALVSPTLYFLLIDSDAIVLTVLFFVGFLTDFFAGFISSIFVSGW